MEIPDLYWLEFNTGFLGVPGWAEVVLIRSSGGRAKLCLGQEFKSKVERQNFVFLLDFYSNSLLYMYHEFIGRLRSHFDSEPTLARL